jgi:nucleotide-binding universal stress UspA family protein
MTLAQNPDRIVVGVDGSEQSRQALRWALRQAEVTGAVVEAVIGWEPPFTGWGGDVPAAERKELGVLAEKVLTENVAKVSGSGAGVEVRTRAAEGTPAQVLLTAAADDDVVLLVVGSRGIGGFAGALLGSVGQHCVQHAPCPVVVVRGRDSLHRRSGGAVPR